MDKLPLVPANEEILAAALYELPEETLSISLRKQIKGLSPLLADNLALLAGLDPAMPVETVGEYEIGLIYRQLQLLDQRISNNDYDPIITLSGKQFRDYYAFDPPSWSQLHKQHFSSMNDAIDAFYQACEKQQSFERKKASLAKALRQNRSRLQKKIALEEADLATCEAANIYREAGDILSANLYFLRKGLSEVELPSFTEEGKTVHIKLDPAKTPQENIKYYYKRYSKAKNARHRIDCLLYTSVLLASLAVDVSSLTELFTTSAAKPPAKWFSSARGKILFSRAAAAKTILKVEAGG